MKYCILLLLCIHTSDAAHLPFIVSEAKTDSRTTGYIFSHGLASTHRQALGMFSHLEPHGSYRKYWMVGNPLVLFDFADAKSDNKIEWHAHQVNLGQQQDIASLKKAYDFACEQLPDYQFVMAGVSRGAASTLNFLARHHPLKVRAVVLECPFDTFDAVVQHLLRQVHMKWIPYSDNAAKKYMAYMFPLINTNGIVPLHSVKAIAHTIPILFIHSKKDNTVPTNSSRMLYCTLKQEGHPCVYLCEFETGAHAKLLKSTEAELCHSVIHAFYKHCNLPCDENAARYAYDYFISHCQPSVDEVKALIHQYRSVYTLSIQQQAELVLKIIS